MEVALLLSIQKRSFPSNSHLLRGWNRFPKCATHLFSEVGKVFSNFSHCCHTARRKGRLVCLERSQSPRSHHQSFRLTSERSSP